MNKNDFLIISHLRRDARESLTKMAKKTNLPISTIYDKLKAHEKEIIKKHTCLLDFVCLGFNAKANIMLKVEKSERAELRNFLLKHQNVNSAYKISNSYDFLLEVVFRNIKDLEDFVENIESKFKIKDKQVYFVVEDLKREAFLSDPTVFDLIQ
jgi:DNA-binding Lrp family transcriptional regulator